MSEYNRVQLNTIYLTDDGTADGVPCRLEVSGLDGLSISFAVQNSIAADGTPWAFVTDDGGKGQPIKIALFVTTADLLSSLKTLISDALSGDETINVKIDGDTGNFDLDCQPAGPKPMEFPGDFFDGQVYNVALNFLVVSVN